MAAHPIHSPGGLSRLIYRLPIGFFRLRLGWLLSNHFLLLTHTGRKSGLPRYAVIEVMRYDKMADTYIVASGFGENADWLLNLQKTPQAEIQIGFRSLKVEAHQLPLERAEREVLEYGRRHLIILHMLARIVGIPFDGTEEGIRILTRSVLIVAFSPRNK